MQKSLFITLLGLPSSRLKIPYVRLKAFSAILQSALKMTNLTSNREFVYLK